MRTRWTRGVEEGFTGREAGRFLQGYRRFGAQGWRQNVSGWIAGRSLALAVGGSLVLAVGGSLALAVDGSLALAVGGSLALAVGGSLALAVGGSLALRLAARWRSRLAARWRSRLAARWRSRLAARWRSRLATSERSLLRRRPASPPGSEATGRAVSPSPVHTAWATQSPASARARRAAESADREAARARDVEIGLARADDRVRLVRARDQPDTRGDHIRFASHPLGERHLISRPERDRDLPGWRCRRSTRRSMSAPSLLEQNGERGRNGVRPVPAPVLGRFASR